VRGKSGHLSVGLPQPQRLRGWVVGSMFFFCQFTCMVGAWQDRVAASG
jgi:hypothetical protein